MSFFQKLGIAFKFWDFKRAPAITALFVIIMALIGVGLGYGVWSIFAD